jgi:hypothetical protein
MSLWSSPSFNSDLVASSFAPRKHETQSSLAPLGGTKLMSHTIQTTGLGTSYIKHVSGGAQLSIPTPSPAQREESWRFSLFYQYGGWKRESERRAYEKKVQDSIPTPRSRRRQLNAAEDAFKNFVKEVETAGGSKKCSLGALRLYEPPVPGKALADADFAAWVQEKDSKCKETRRNQRDQDRKIALAVQENLRERARVLAEKLGVRADSFQNPGPCGVPRSHGGLSKKEKLIHRQVQDLRKAHNPLAKPIRLQLPRKKSSSSSNGSGSDIIARSSQISDSSEASASSGPVVSLPDRNMVLCQTSKPELFPCVSASKALILEERLAQGHAKARSHMRSQNAVRSEPRRKPPWNDR